jgi:hypothetical protein
MAVFRETTVTNGEKKTRQGMSTLTRSGTKPQTHMMAVPKKTLQRYKKKYRGQGKNR